MKPLKTTAKHPLKTPAGSSPRGFRFPYQTFFFPTSLESFPTCGRKYSVAIFCGYLALHRSNARKASTQAQVFARLGELSYENGRYAEAALYLQQAMATGACTNAAAILHLAEMYYVGMAVEKNNLLSKKYAEMAVRLGNRTATKFLTEVTQSLSNRVDQRSVHSHQLDKR